MRKLIRKTLIVLAASASVISVAIVVPWWLFTGGQERNFVTGSLGITDRDWAYYRDAGSHFFSSGDYKTSLEYLNKNVSLNPQRGSYLMRAQVYEKLGQHDLAVRDANTLLELYNKELRDRRVDPNSVSSQAQELENLRQLGLLGDVRIRKVSGNL